MDHDYYAPGTYHIILKKKPGCVAFGRVAGNPRVAPGMPGCAYIDRSPLGKILHKEIYDMPKYHPILQVYQYVVMPDHAHILLRVKERTPRHLGYYINNLKAAVTTKWRRYNGWDAAYSPDRDISHNHADSNSCVVMRPAGDMFPSTGKNTCEMTVFEENYTDKIVFAYRSLDVLYRYIRENPHRLAVRRLYPDFFRRVRRLRVGDRDWEAYGNVFLLRNPFKEQVVVHRKDSDNDFEYTRERWLENVADGGVLVSPFISPREKKIRRDAEGMGGRVILITNEPFGERYKPAEHDFNLCEEGRLLIVAPVEPFGATLERSTCLKMNATAKEICGEDFEI